MNFKLFKDRNFLLLMQGKFVSQLGTNIQTFALSLYVLNMYDSATLFASILMIAFIPRILLSPIAGVFVDWFDRKKMIVILDVLSGIIVLSLAVLYYNQQILPLWSIYAITIVLALIGVLFGPAVSTVIPVIMEDDKLFEANTWDHMMMTIANILGPIIAGIFMSFFSIGVIIIINGVSFLLSALSEGFIKLPKAHKEHDQLNFSVFKSDFVEGIGYFKVNPILMKVLIVSFFLNFALAPIFSVTIPFILKKVLLVSDVHFGMFESIVVGASLIGMMFAGMVSKKFSLEKILIVDVFAQPIVIGIIGFISSTYFISLFTGYMMPLISMIVVASLVIVIITIGNIAFGTMLQKMIPKDLLGRVQTLTGTISMAAIPLGQGLMGIALDRYEPFVPIAISILFMLFIAVYTKRNFAEGTLSEAAPGLVEEVAS